jgi:mono/diheme cytochrome c family protein
MARRVIVAACVAAAAAFATACGSSAIKLTADDPNHAGAQIFVERCGACHTLSVAGTQGSATKVTDKENVDGPSFDARKENASDVVYAIANGGFSGAIMPENLVTGQEAQKVADFLAKYAGPGAPKPPQ